MTAKDAVKQAKEALNLEWTSNADRDTLAGFVDQLAGELATPLSTLQTVQLLWLPADASSRHKLVARRVLDKLAESLPMLEQHEYAVAWAQALAWSALRVGLDAENGAMTAIFIALMRSGSEWSSTDERKKRLWKELLIKAEVTCRIRQFPDDTRYEPFSGWPNDDTEEDFAAAADAIKHIETHLKQPLAAPGYVIQPLETLWWGQSLYSPSLHESYRDLNDPEKLFWMAEDMAQLPLTCPSEALTAFFTETLRRVDESIDKQATIADHARRLIFGVQGGITREPNATIGAVPQQLHDAIDKDPTGLPITFIVEGAHRRMSDDTIISDLQRKTCVDITRVVSTRQWARWVCRERLLVHFLRELVKE